ncbi:hypothetical protein SAMN05421829_113117 [Aromatoleum tolulyticum]|uniref:PXPV repeat-containing protein n=1 Tax=Aromatoleum tolulyticum TaxID=34027 RepID=A0A1N7A727_9RHOO|nr:hypothetical protein [Aromatoleum tolulyticum]SIR34833.1 hypothetical protein SAMN05421829_113117 [Aromatoleum tolulyticum]
MKSKALKLLAAMIAGGTLIAATPAHADRDHWRDDGYREWRGDDHRHGHYKKYRDRERIVIRERIVERRPVVREYRYYERPIGYYAPAPVYAPVYAPRYYPRDPAITIGVDIPPLVIPLR